MRRLFPILLLCLVGPTVAYAQPAAEEVVEEAAGGGVAQPPKELPAADPAEVADPAAQPAPPAQPVTTARPPATTAAPAGATVAAPDKYESPMKDQCMEELRKDKGWRASLKGELRLEVHQEEATLIANNKKHVYMAYAALWIILVVFVVFGWRRQRSLRAEIERLQADVAAAVKE